MPYRLPSPWDPGFALPANVKDEGLERHAFVTKQARRGTYDNPRVGTGGYVVPQYVQDEGYGQGAVTTAWLPPGSTPGFRVGHDLNQRPTVVADTGRKVTFSRQATPVRGAGPGVVQIPAAYQRFGQRAATAVLKNNAKLPQAHRPAQMKAALDAVDRKLWPRAVAAAKATGSVHAGLSHAFSTTLLEQVIATGKSGKRPSGGLMGLAGMGTCCGGGGIPSALGATPPSAGRLASPGVLAQLTAALIPSVVSGPGGIAPGTCTADGNFIWDAGGYWRRKLVGESCASIGTATVTTNSGAQGGVTITSGTSGGTKVVPTKVAPIVAPGTTKLIQVGPFTFPLVDNMRIHWDGLLPDDWRAAINQQITRDCSPCISSSMRPATGYFASLKQFLGPEMPSKINHDFFGMHMGAGATVQASDFEPTMPLVRVTRPDTGDDYGLYAYVETRDPNRPYDANTNPYNLLIVWKPITTSVWGWIWQVAATIVDWAGDAISAIGSLTCAVLSNPVGQVGAVAAGAATGGATGAKAGAAGAQIGAQMCAQPPPQVVTAGGGMGVPLVLAGVGVAAAAILLTKKKKRPSP